ncbi:MAG: sigma-70 family RNA polymerase sigma factor [Planctomycetota bacterium]|nr:sigma-70 family RNA polymerase sigma factor [Planctomycetota bacterium]
MASSLKRRLSDGDRDAAAELLPLVYDELKRLAGRYMQGEASSHTLQTTALVHEAYLRLVDAPDAGWENRGHFIGVAATAMRHVLVDHARAKKAGKRGGGRPKISLEEALVLYEERAIDLIALDEALEKLGQLDAQLARIVDLRFFGGLSNAEVASVTGASLRSVERGWPTARAWLRKCLTDAGGAEPGEA